MSYVKTNVKPKAPDGESARRTEARASFVEPFADLLGRVDAARQAEIYPFYGSIRRKANGSGHHVPVVLTANDYLGLTTERRVRDAARDAIERFGTSCCSSPLAGGYTELHRAFEDRLRSFLAQEATALFASGYQANVGIISALMGRGDLILTDLFNHASIIDGSRLSGATIRFFQHNSAKHLESILKREGQGRRALVIVEGVYSADGDIVTLPDICAVAHSHGAMVMIDEAHSLGVLGEHGCGAAEHFGLLDEVDLIMGTLSKSLASVGGFVAGDARLVDVVRHNARSLIFSAVVPPANVATALAALEILEGEPERRGRLWKNAAFFLSGLKELGFDTMRSETPVIPLLVGEELRTIELTARLRDRGVMVCPAIPPMVQAHLSRVRAHVTAAHDEASLATALETIDEVATELQIQRKRPSVDAGETAIPSAQRA